VAYRFLFDAFELREPWRWSSFGFDWDAPMNR
jgi:hypothetical protein